MFGILRATRVAILRRTWIESFAIEEEYDNAYHMFSILSVKNPRHLARATTIDLMEQRVSWLRHRNSMRRANHGGTNQILMISLLLGLLLLIAAIWPWENNIPRSLSEVIKLIGIF